MELREVGPHTHAQLRVEVRERLIHEVHDGATGDRPRHRHPLALSARERERPPIEEILEAQQARSLRDARDDLGPRRAAHLQPEGDVLAHVHVRIQGVVLEHHRDVAVLRRHVGDVLVADDHRSVRDLFQAADAAQERRLSAAGRTDEDNELTVVDRHVDAVHSPNAIRERLHDVSKRDAAHLLTPSVRS